MVMGVNVLRQKVRLLVKKSNDEKEILEYSVDDIVSVTKKKKGIFPQKPPEKVVESAVENTRAKRKNFSNKFQNKKVSR